MSVLKNKNANSRDRTHIDEKEKSHANSREEKSEREQFQRSDTYQDILDMDIRKRNQNANSRDRTEREIINPGIGKVKSPQKSSRFPKIFFMHTAVMYFVACVSS